MQYFENQTSEQYFSNKPTSVWKLLYIDRCSVVVFQNGPVEIEKLVKFLGVDMDDKLKEAILDNCNFKKMATEKTHKEVAEKWFNKDFSFFRKGLSN